MLVPQQLAVVNTWHRPVLMWIQNLATKKPCHSKGIRQRYLGCSSYEALCQCHHVSVVSISLIQLNRSELWVVAGADALITEDTSNLKHPLKSTDNHALEM